MELVLGTLALLVGAALFCLALVRITAANPDGPVPQFWGRPAHFPKVVYLYRLPGVLLLFAGALAWSDVMGPWCGLLIVPAVIPSSIVNTIHNRRVRRRRTPSLV